MMIYNLLYLKTVKLTRSHCRDCPGAIVFQVIVNIQFKNARSIFLRYDNGEQTISLLPGKLKIFWSTNPLTQHRTCLQTGLLCLAPIPRRLNKMRIKRYSKERSQIFSMSQSQNRTWAISKWMKPLWIDLLSMNPQTLHYTLRVRFLIICCRFKPLKVTKHLNREFLSGQMLL